MRLLQAVQQANGETDFSLVEFIDDIPQYAILSHTWGADHEEVTFKDIYKGQGKGRTKPGLKRIGARPMGRHPDFSAARNGSIIG